MNDISHQPDVVSRFVPFYVCQVNEKFKVPSLRGTIIDGDASTVFMESFELNDKLSFLMTTFGTVAYRVTGRLINFVPVTIALGDDVKFEMIDVPNCQESKLVFGLDTVSLQKITGSPDESARIFPCFLDELMQTQHELQVAMGDPLGHGEQAIKEAMLALIVEATEVLDEINWKPWKKSRKNVDRKSLLTELNDILQFWANAMRAANYTPDEIREAMREKWRVNYERIEGGY